jgi:hypothetical protein
MTARYRPFVLLSSLAALIVASALGGGSILDGLGATQVTGGQEGNGESLEELFRRLVTDGPGEIAERAARGVVRADDRRTSSGDQDVSDARDQARRID